jgi:N-acetylglucosamine transport system substrate-binding protein
MPICDTLHATTGFVEPDRVITVGAAKDRADVTIAVQLGVAPAERNTFMRKSRFAAVAAVGVAAALVLTGCGSSGSAGDSSSVLKVAAFEGGYGKDLYIQAAQQYEKLTGTKVDITVSKTLPTDLAPQVAAGDYPDVVLLGLGGKDAFTEKFVRNKELTDLTDVLDMTVPGESDTVRSKLTDGIIGNTNTDPYGDGHTYLMPINASPTGLVYNKGLFQQKGWTVPTTWDQMFALGDKAKAEGISLFTYPTSGYLDTYFYSLAATIGGPSFYNDVTHYKKDIWETPQAKQALDLTYKLLTKYSAPTTVGYANSQDYLKNQQTVLDNKTLFMPDGTWVDKEMAAAPRAKGFEWGLMPVPAVTPDATRYATTFIESAWVPKEAEHVDEAKKFIAFLYSDEVGQTFLKAGDVQPIKSVVNGLSGTLGDFYSVYKEPDVKALVGSFAGTTPVAGVDLPGALYGSADSILQGKMTEEQWQQKINDASNQLTDAIQK